MQQRVLQSAGVTVRENETVAVNLIVKLGLAQGRARRHGTHLGFRGFCLMNLVKRT